MSTTFDFVDVDDEDALVWPGEAVVDEDDDPGFTFDELLGELT